MLRAGTNSVLQYRTYLFATVLRIMRASQRKTALRTFFFLPEFQRGTGSVRQVREAETEAARVRGEIECMDADRETIEIRVSFAMIRLKLWVEYQAKLGSSVPSAAILFLPFRWGR